MGQIFIEDNINFWFIKMPALSLVIAPDPIFKMKSAPVEVNAEIQKLMDDLLETIYSEQAAGIAAPMVGVLKQVVVIDLQEEGQKNPLFMANPEIIERSEEMQTFTEGSLCYPGISEKVTRPTKITVKYLDYNGVEQILTADDFLATCILHEVDYLHGVTFLDYVSKVKRDILMRKMAKFKKHGYKPHVHGEHCNHG